jgi:L-rhamnose isomerase
MNQLSKVKNALLGLLLAPFYILEERERDKKMQERIARLEEKKQWALKN